MGAVAVFITVIGWSFFGRIFSVTENATASTAWLKPYADSPLENIIAIVPDEPACLNRNANYGRSAVVKPGDARRLCQVIKPGVAVRQSNVLHLQLFESALA